MAPSNALGRLLRKVRPWARGWSGDADRSFHDALFSQRAYDPFTFSYPGYVTIRRFADLASARIADARRVIDLGCGPGEITCELARRHPATAFVGIDHSGAAVQRGQEHAARMGLGNVTFRAADVESLRLSEPADLILMFDSFHHLLAPQAFVRRMRDCCSRFFLIEPRGNWSGAWQKDLDFDWLIRDLHKIGTRAEYLSAAPVQRPAAADPPGNLEGTPVEHRYTMDDFTALFDGYALEVSGTIAGFESYPPDPFASSPVRETLGRFAYELVVEIESSLRRRDLDLLAKHWAIYAHRGGSSAARRTPDAIAADRFPLEEIVGRCDIEYLDYAGPETGLVGEKLTGLVRLKNRSWRHWSSTTNQNPILVSYHWLDSRGAMIVRDGSRSRLPRAVEPGGECNAELTVTAPSEPGRYVLAIDLVEEGINWFSEAGQPCLRVPFRVTPK